MRQRSLLRLMGMVLGTAGLALGTAGQAGAEPPAAAAHLQRANELLSQDQLAAACDELEAAYATSTDPGACGPRRCR